MAWTTPRVMNPRPDIVLAKLIVTSAVCNVSLFLAGGLLAYSDTIPPWATWLIVAFLVNLVVGVQWRAVLRWGQVSTQRAIQRGAVGTWRLTDQPGARAVDGLLVVCDPADAALFSGRCHIELTENEPVVDLVQPPDTVG